VNLNQLQATEKKLSSGIAAAMAMTTPVILPGKSNAVALGVGYYNQAGAVSLNLAHKFSEEIVATASGSYGFNSQSTSVGSNSDFGARASLSYSF
jgi:autotransporter adhesin